SSYTLSLHDALPISAIRVIFSMQIKSSPFLVQVLQTVIALFGLRNLLLFIHPTIVNPLNYLCLTTDGIFYCSLTLLVFPSSILNCPVCHCFLQDKVPNTCLVLFG